MNILESHCESQFARELLEFGSSTLHERFNDLWTNFSGLEDSHFWNSIDTDSSSRIWEMITAYILREDGFTLESDNEGPDLLAYKNGKLIMYIECIAPSGGREDLPDSVPEIGFSTTEFTPIPNDQILLRVCAAIRDKKKKHQQYLEKGTVAPDIPYVIAVSGMKLGSRSSMTPQVGLQSVLGFGPPYTIFNSKTKSTIHQGFKHRASISKSNDSIVDTQVFLSKDYESISAIIYSDTCFSCTSHYDPFSESIAIHNPRASNRLPSDTFIKLPSLWTIASSNYEQWFSFKL